jgi:RimJ/RimL family protein N-acetyltransferase
MEKDVSLKNGTGVTVRDLRPDDVQRSFDFFAALPEEDRRYLRVDVTRWEFVERRAKEIDPTRVRRLVVEEGGEIVGDGSIELAGHGWGDNIAEIRLIISRDFQRRGLGLLLARELYFIATEAKVDRIVARMMRPQIGAQRIMRRLGFHDEFLIPEHVRDQDGDWQDMIIMRCNLEDLWREMEGAFEDSDIQWHR